MIATAESFDNGGFVAPGPDATFVYLSRSADPQTKQLIFAFSEGQPEPNGRKIEMNWLTPAHLELAYQGERTIDFQAVKYAGVEISVRELSQKAARP
jgi:hypothetical protein